MLSHPTVKIGDTARFPLRQLGDEAVYRYRWEATAFRPDGSVLCRRLHDRFEKVLSVRWWDRYQTEDRYVTYQEKERQLTERRQAIAQLRAKRLQSAQLQTDPTQPGFYVSARKGPQYVLLLGPFVSLYDALQLVEPVWPLVREYNDPFCEVAVGTCKTVESTRIGKFNERILGR